MVKKKSQKKDQNDQERSKSEIAIIDNNPPKKKITRKRKKVFRHFHPTNNTDNDPIRRQRFFDVCMWYAQFYDTDEVKVLLKKKYGLDISGTALNKFRKLPKWNRIIFYLRKKWLNNLSSEPLYHSKERLKRYNKIYKLALEERLKSCGKYGDVYDIDLSSALKAISLAKEEISPKNRSLIFEEGSKPIFQDINIEEMTYEQAVKTVSAGLSKRYT